MAPEAHGLTIGAVTGKSLSPICDPDWQGWTPSTTTGDTLAAHHRLAGGARTKVAGGLGGNDE
jgi:hypothetical protein